MLGLTATPVGTKIEIQERDIRTDQVEEKLDKSVEAIQHLLAARIVAAPEDQLAPFKTVRVKCCNCRLI